ncbi:MAG TPA: DNA helicase Rep [Gammaproteobacteria bacterium]|nr:DNA helicase Rep [Gammaproteobacteria bacterium]
MAAMPRHPVSLASLNPAQRKAVTHIDGPLLVLAGAGSGKTRVITQKIAYLVDACGIAADHIAAVTFTNKAAREMKQRVTRLVSAEQARALTVSTFHTLGLKILRQEHARIGYKRGFTLFDAEDSLGLLRELLKLDKAERAEVLERAQWQISAWKSALRTPEQVLADESDPNARRSAQLYAEYERHLKAYNAMDFDDLIVRPVRLLEAFPDARENWQNRLRYLLVDEYQDTNAAQYRLLKLLAGPRAAFTVVGDDDQSIYSWRGAQPENLSLLKQDFPTLQAVKLEQNYRSTRRILRVANALISNNPHVFEKKLWSELGEGEPVRVMACSDAQHEVERVVAELLQHRLEHKQQFRDYAVLYRSNHQSRLFERALRERRVPYRLAGGTSFFDRAEVRDLVAYLRLLVNPDDDSAFLRVVNVPRREIGAATLEKLGGYAGKRGISLFSACFELGVRECLTAQAAARLHEFGTWISRVAEHAEHESAAHVMKELLEYTRYADWLRDNARDPKAAEKKLENVDEFTGWLSRPSTEPGEERTLADTLAQLSLMDMLDRNKDEDAGDAVSLMTLHAAKGLEFPHVFLVGMEEELLPHRNSMEGENVDEERRLAYVGITRAQRTLTLSYAARRRKYGEDRDCEPSRFLKELPESDLQWSDAARPVTDAERQQHGRLYLDQIRGLLADT